MGGKGGTEVDTSAMEGLYREALDHAIAQDSWNRQFLQTQWEWAAQDRERQLVDNATDRSMFYSMLGQDRGYAQDQYAYNKAANEADRAMFQKALGQHQASIDAANARMREEWQFNKANIEADRAYYDATFKPLEQDLVADSSATEGDFRRATAQAAADVAGIYDKQMGIQRREAARYGINPMSGRYASGNRAIGIARSGAEVGARNQAREQVRDRADANRALALNVGQTHRNTQVIAPNRYGAYNMASFKSTPVKYDAPLATPGSYSGFGIPGSYTSKASGTAQNFGNAMGNAAAQQAQANAASQSGLFSAIGTGLGIWAGLSSREYKERIRDMDRGEALALIQAVDVVRFRYKPEWAAPGEMIGAIAEDVPEPFAAEDRKALNLYNLVGALVGAVQALQARLELAENKLEHASPTVN